MRLANLSLTYAHGSPPFALRDVSLEIAAGRCLVVLGPSGSGKTTLLRIVAGLERPQSGRVFFDGRDVTGEAPERRRAGVVFAEDALFPHLTAYENVAYGVVPADAARVRAAAERMRVAHLLDRNAAKLSGGERQRVALARALAIEPAVLLLDEPLSRLDAPLRLALRRELGAVLRSGNETTLLVTHDQSEAMALADTIALVRDGALVQAGPPRELYDRPNDRFVASFVGAPAMSFVPAAALPGLRAPHDATAGIRPDALRIDERGALAGVVTSVADLGGEAFAEVESDAGAVTVRVGPPLPRVGERVTLALDVTAVYLFDANGSRVDTVPHA